MGKQGVSFQNPIRPACAVSPWKFLSTLMLAGIGGLVVQAVLGVNTTIGGCFLGLLVSWLYTGHGSLVAELESYVRMCAWPPFIVITWS